MRIKPKARKILKVILVVASITISPFLFFHLVFFERNLPNTYIADINVGGLTINDRKKTRKRNKNSRQNRNKSKQSICIHRHKSNKTVL